MAEITPGEFMNEPQLAQKSRPTVDVLNEVLDSRRPKSEHEHVAARVVQRLMESLKECSDDLEICIEQEYAPLRGYPAYERKRQRDLGIVRDARDILEIYKFIPK